MSEPGPLPVVVQGGPLVVATLKAKRGHDGKLRKIWEELNDLSKWSWEHNPEPRPWRTISYEAEDIRPAPVSVDVAKG